MNSENSYNTELIEKYLSGTLDENQRKQVEAKLISEADFQDEVRVQKQIRDASFIVGREQLRNRLKEIHEEIGSSLSSQEQTADDRRGNSSIKRFIDTNKYLLIAACISIFVATTFITLNVDLRNNNQTIFQEYFEPYPNIASIQYRDDDVAQTEYERAFAAYDEGNYDRSIKIFKGLLAKEKDEITLFYLGLAYLASGDAQNAVDILREYVDSYHEFESEAKWYLGLAYIKEGKKEEARKIFEDLSRVKNDFTPKAIRILNELN